MDQAWKSINGFIVSFTYSFDQLKIQNSTRKFKKKKKKKKTKIILEKCQSPSGEGIYAAFKRGLDY